MKRLVRLIGLVLVLCTVFVATVHATEAVEPRASAYFGAHDAFLAKIDSNKFQVWYDVTACTLVTELGVKSITVYRSHDQTNWTEMITYSCEDYPDMIVYNSISHAGYVTYWYPTPGYYYRAHITFHAKNSSGSASLFRYTAIMQM